MKIDFYEEFPLQENLEKIKLINFDSRLFVASRSVNEFKEIEDKIKILNNKITCGYWPIVKNSYWISPFSNHEDLIELFNGLNSITNPILIDLELPLDRSLIEKNVFDIIKNKKVIKKFMISNSNRITTSQGLNLHKENGRLIKDFLGLDYPVKTEKSLMWYSSMASKKLNEDIRIYLKGLKNKDDYSISLGTIDLGIRGNEPILSPENLQQDINYIRKLGFNKIIIFRLGGLNDSYLKVLSNFLIPSHFQLDI
jgi:hypothetical protein